MRSIFFFLCLFIITNSFCQDITSRLSKAVEALQSHPTMKHASIGFYVVESKTGKAIFEKNPHIGLAPASTLKVVTSATAYEVLGKDFRYETKILLAGDKKENSWNGQLIVEGSGDPTLGSWRWNTTSIETIGEKLAKALKAKGVSKITGQLQFLPGNWDNQATPDGWTWEDIGNYFGAGARILNWHENSYKLNFRPGKNIGDATSIISTEPNIPGIQWINEIKTAKAGSGDNAVIYLPEKGTVGYLRGTIPAGVEKFTIRGSIPSVEAVIVGSLNSELKKHQVISELSSSETSKLNTAGSESIGSFYSPPLDSINYWFMKESINLYGEALLKTMAEKRKGRGETRLGVDLVKDFWKDKGIDAGALKIQDGSGLSPANRITPHALVTILQHASKQPWFNSFYHSLPVQNNIRMKSGYIGGVRSYAGFIKSKSGEEYSFAFIINNFDGSASAAREKMWQVLDILK